MVKKMFSSFLGIIAFVVLLSIPMIIFVLPFRVDVSLLAVALINPQNIASGANIIWYGMHF